MKLCGGEEDKREEELFWTPASLALLYAAGQVLHCFPEDRGSCPSLRPVLETVASAHHDLVVNVEVDAPVADLEESPCAHQSTSQTHKHTPADVEKASAELEVDKHRDDLGSGSQVETTCTKDEDRDKSSEDVRMRTTVFVESIEVFLTNKEDPALQQDGNKLSVSVESRESDSLNRRLSLLSRRVVRHMNLKNMCRSVIRRHLTDHNPQTHLFQKVHGLILPPALQSYLVFNLSLEEDAETMHEAIVTFWMLVN